MTPRYALIFCLLFALDMNAQLPLPDSAARWVNTLYSVEPFPPPATYTLMDVDNLCANGEDTTMLGHSYTKLDHCGGPYKGAFRQDTGAVWYVPADSLQEYLLYDFGAQPGETMQVYFEQGLSGSGMLMDVTVNSIFPDNLLQNRNVTYLNEGAMWIEGIGAAWGLFSEPYINVSLYDLRLECMSHLDSVHYPSWAIGAGECELDMQVHEPRGSAPVIVPNPTNGPVRIELEAPGLNVFIAAVDGRTVDLVPVRSGSSVVYDLSWLPVGTYIVHTSDGRASRVVLTK